MVYLREKEDDLFKEQLVGKIRHLSSDTLYFVLLLILNMMTKTLALILTYLWQDGGDIVNEVMKIVISRGATMSDPTSARIFIEGTEVLQDLDVPRACALLMGLIYGLNLSYPKELKNTFEVFQKIFLELDGLKASLKVMSLKSKLLC